MFKMNNLKVLKVSSTFWKAFLLILVSLSLVFSFSEAEAKKRKRKKKSKLRRVYNPTKTRSEALLMIRANSDELSELAGLQPIEKSELPKHLFSNHSELENLDEPLDKEDVEGMELALLETENIASEANYQKLYNDVNNIDQTTVVNYYEESKFDKDYFTMYQEQDENSQAFEEYYYEESENPEGLIGDAGEDLSELALDNEPTMTMEEFKALWLSYVTEGKNFDETEAGVKKSEIMEIILSWFGTPYKFGGTSDNAIDCSAFVRTVYSTATEMQLPRTAREQFTVGKIVRNRKDLKFGDMVFFNTRKRVRVSHVGIYLGDNLFAHASSRSGVTVSSLVQDYYNKKFIGARRISYETVNQLSTKTDRNQPTN